MKASFVVIAYNEERHIEPTIRSIAQQSGLPSDYEIVVIDDASTDRTAKIVTACAAELVAVRLVTLERNSGRGAARAGRRRGSWRGNRDDRLRYCPAARVVPAL